MTDRNRPPMGANAAPVPLSNRRPVRSEIWAPGWHRWRSEQLPDANVGHNAPLVLHRLAIHPIRIAIGTGPTSESKRVLTVHSPDRRLSLLRHLPLLSHDPSAAARLHPSTPPSAASRSLLPDSLLNGIHSLRSVSASSSNMMHCMMPVATRRTPAVSELSRRPPMTHSGAFLFGSSLGRAHTRLASTPRRTRRSPSGHLLFQRPLPRFSHLL
ncbi:hypothetical protein VTO73DRAFT_6022 [Trametes versicolor]